MKFPFLLIIALLLPLQAEDQPAKPIKPNQPPVEVRKLLSSHSTVAKFTGIAFQPCRHRTAQCPDQCTHAGKVASFKIIEYLDYQKLGKYGDPKSASFRTMVEDQLGHAKIPAATLKSINSLKKGDTVWLSWNHDYVTQNGSSYPERTITKLSKVAPK